MTLQYIESCKPFQNKTRRSRWSIWTHKINAREYLNKFKELQEHSNKLYFKMTERKFGLSHRE